MIFKRLNIKPEYSLYPLPKSGHRSINKSMRSNKKYYYTVFLHHELYKRRTFKNLTDALCYKFIVILKYRAQINHHR